VFKYLSGNFLNINTLIKINEQLWQSSTRFVQASVQPQNQVNHALEDVFRFFVGEIFLSSGLAFVWQSSDDLWEFKGLSLAFDLQGLCGRPPPLQQSLVGPGEPTLE
jgi:hypothetical protein